MEDGKDIVICCCRDEEDIIEVFIKFYIEMGFDNIFIIDNLSVDKTTEIVNSLIQCDYPVHLRIDNRIGYEKYLTEYYQWAVSMVRSRWVFFLDCDEFIIFPNGVKSYLASLDSEVNCIQLQQKEMFPYLVSDTRKGAFLLSNRSERGFNDTKKEVGRYHPKAKVYAGKHCINFPNKCMLFPNDIYIQHFKYRSIAQAKRKETNRIQAHKAMTAEDLHCISAFGVEVSSSWISYCRNAFINGTYLKAFNKQIEFDIDEKISGWAEKFITQINKTAN